MRFKWKALPAMLASACVFGSMLGSMAQAATLAARDFNHDGAVDAYYDASSNLTWLADASAMQAGPFKWNDYPELTADGAAMWFAANWWATSLNIHGVTGWRLPHVVDATTCWVPDGAPHAVCDHTVQAGTSELQNLLQGTLGNPQGSLVHTGPFVNVKAGNYWTDTPVEGIPTFGGPVWTYGTLTGAHQMTDQIFSPSYAWAVRSGDVSAAAVPEPDGLMLGLVGGLVALAGLKRRNQA